MLNTDVIQNILSYSGDFRILKIKMDKSNIKYLFDNDKNICHYLHDKTSSTTATLGEGIYLTTVELLKDSNMNIENVFENLVQEYKKWNNHVSYEYFNFIIEMIIDDYNEFYLNDEYYYGGYWYDERWVLYDDE